jgi:hypothetical protein
MERQSSGFRDRLPARQARGAGAASAIPLQASRCIGCSMECTLYAASTPLVQLVAAGLAATVDCTDTCRKHVLCKAAAVWIRK